MYKNRLSNPFKGVDELKDKIKNYRMASSTGEIKKIIQQFIARLFEN